jgi:hypothetical protein
MMGTKKGGCSLQPAKGNHLYDNKKFTVVKKNFAEPHGKTHELQSGTDSVRIESSFSEIFNMDR